jgi:hypothetical protein
MNIVVLLMLAMSALITIFVMAEFFIWAIGWGNAGELNK